MSGPSGQASEQVGAGDRDERRPAVPIWARPGARRRSPLSREAIVASAISIADAEGLAAVSIRRVAAALGTRAMTLYTYIDSKDDLLDLMVDEIARELLIEGELPGGWREAVTLIARREREVVHRHPWIVDLMSHRPRVMVGPNGLRHLEQSMAALSGLGLEPADAWRILAAVDDYVRGHLIREIWERRAPGGGVTTAEREAFLRPYIEELIGSDGFENIAPLLRGCELEVSDFDQGLAWMLDGIERTHVRR